MNELLSEDHLQRLAEFEIIVRVVAKNLKAQLKMRDERIDDLETRLRDLEDSREPEQVV